MSAVTQSPPTLSLREFLSPAGRPWRFVAYALAFQFVQLMPANLGAWRQENFWAMAVNLLTTAIETLAIVGLLWLIALRAPRFPVLLATALAILPVFVAGQMAWLWLALDQSPFASGRDYWHRVMYSRGGMMYLFLGALAWYWLQRNDLRLRQLHESRMTAQRLEAGVAEARLGAMQAQVEPHFLFNTLAHVKWLYQRDPRQASRMLDRFVTYLRGALPRMRQQESTLAEELELARAYLEVQKIRMGPRLTFGIHVSDWLRGHRFPAMMLISLVENSVKHGLSRLPNGGEVHISAASSGGRLLVEVDDTGAGLSGSSVGTGIGLSNIRGRLKAMFGDAASLNVRTSERGGVCAAIEIPSDEH